MIEYTSLKGNYDLFASEYEEAALRVMRSGWYIMGPELEWFEQLFADYLGVKHCIGLNSGTDALILAVRALGIGVMAGGSAEDEVIVPAGTYIASVLGITENGAKPVYIDSDPDTLLMDVSAIERAITDRTKAILPVHLYGRACDMDAVMAVAERHGIYVIEDCAQSHGAFWSEQPTGTWGDIGCFSFYPTKPLGALGDAGACVTDDDELADRLRMLRNYGSRVKYHNESIGRNSRLDELQAACLSVGVSHLDTTNDMRIGIAKKYLAGIRSDKVKLPGSGSVALAEMESFGAGASGAGNPGVSVDPGDDLFVVGEPSRSGITPNAAYDESSDDWYDEPGNVYHLFPVLVDDQAGFIEYMECTGIKTQVHYPIPPFLAECYRGTSAEGREEDYPVAAYIAKHEVSLPIYAGMPDEDVEAVIRAVNGW